MNPFKNETRNRPFIGPYIFWASKAQIQKVAIVQSFLKFQSPVQIELQTSFICLQLDGSKKFESNV